MVLVFGDKFLKIFPSTAVGVGPHHYFCSIANLSLQAVTGRYVNQTFDPSTGDFSVTFAANTSLSAYQSIIYLNEKLYYPAGYSVR